MKGQRHESIFPQSQVAHHSSEETNNIPGRLEYLPVSLMRGQPCESPFKIDLLITSSIEGGVKNM
jgi:hypothetical protein